MALGFYLNKNSVFASYSIQQNGNRKILKYFPGMVIDPLMWNRDTQSTGDANHDLKLAQLKVVIPEVVKEHDPFSMTNDTFTRYIETKLKRFGHKSREKQNSFFEYADNFYQEKLALLGYISAKSVGTTIGILKEYNKSLTFDSFNNEFYRKFLLYLQTVNISKKKGVVKHYKKNTISRQFVNLKSILTQATKDEVNTQLKFMEYKRMDEEVYNVYLTMDMVKKIHALEFTTTDNPREDYKKYFDREAPKFTDKKIAREVKDTVKALKRAQKLFVIGCLTGLRCENYLEIDPDIQVSEDGKYLNAIANKNGERLSIPLHRIAREIFSDGFPETMSQQRLNEHIKTLGRLAGFTHPVVFSQTEGGRIKKLNMPFYMKMTTHTARRSYCSIKVLKGIPVRFIMPVSGHRTEKSFNTYIAAVLKDMLTQKMIEYDDLED